MAEPTTNAGSQEQTDAEFERMLRSKDFATIEQLTDRAGLRRLAEGARSVDDLGTTSSEPDEALPRRR
jgi:hypothetical protein